MAKKRKKEDKAEVVTPAVVEQTPTPVSTRNLERPKGSIRIVRGRKDVKS